MPHGDHSHFSASLTKQEAYRQLLESMHSLARDQRNWVCSLANASSLLWHMYHSIISSSSVNWAGFYVLDKSDPTQLILGPFQGKVACQTIRIGKGVCGTAASDKTTVLVEDVRSFPGHIACDGESRSEIVAPIVVAGKVVGVIDVDCADLNGFDQTDREGLEALAKLLGDCCDWSG